MSGQRHPPAGHPRTTRARGPPAGNCFPPRCPTSWTARSPPAGRWPWAAARWQEGRRAGGTGAESRFARAGRRWWRARARSSCRRTASSFCCGTWSNYYCAYPVCEVSGGAGAKLAWGWAESLYLPKSEAKGKRDEFIGKNFPRHDRHFFARRRRPPEILHAMVARRALVPALHQDRGRTLTHSPAGAR